MGRKIELNHITKVEGHASLSLGLDGKKVTHCKLEAEEGSRYFEGLVVGRGYREASEITSRICGICSCAHTICSITAIENALKIEPSEQTVKLRTLLTFAERIRSHATHLYFLSLPDYLGYESALAMAPKYKKELQLALSMMKVGNDLILLIGGRYLHPTSATVGGWLHLPKNSELREIAKRLEALTKPAAQTVKLFAKLKQPQFNHSTEYFSLYNHGEYATLHGDLVSQSSRFRRQDYEKYLKEYQETYATSNFVVKEGKSYMVGALARMNNNHPHLNDKAQAMIKKYKLFFPMTNPFMNNLCQAIELVHMIEESKQICQTLEIKEEEPLPVTPKAGRGIGAIEVPRGVLWHDYTLDEKGKITKAVIITPTCQNLRNMQDDIETFVPQIADLPKEEMILEIEKLIRSYDPCFSCSTHFLKVKWV